MGDVNIKQILSLSIARAPSIVGAAITEKDFEISNEILDFSDYNEDYSGRFQVAASATAIALSIGTVQLGKMLVLRPAADIVVRVTNGLGVSQSITFKGGKTSIMHMEFTALAVDNPSAVVLKGSYAVAGD